MSVALNAVKNYGPTILNHIAIHHNKINTTWNLIESALVFKGEQSIHFFDKLGKHKNKIMFINFGSIALQMIELAYLINKHNILQHVSYHQSEQLFQLIFSGTIISSTLASFAVLELIKCFEKYYLETPSQTESKRPMYEENKQFFYLFRIALNVHLFAFSGGNPIFAINIVAESYNLYTVTSHHWMTVKEKISTLASNLYSSISLKYSLLLRSDKKKQLDLCTICIEEEDTSKKIHFCANHVFHKHCITEYIESKLKSIQSVIYVGQREVRMDSSKKAVYYVNVPLDNKPSCPNCRDTADFNHLEIEINDLQHGNSKAVVNWV